jgi:ketosteroid isomerase-like protein
MTDARAETLRKAMEAYNRRDMDAWLLLHDPEFEFRADPEWPESETVRGRAAVWDFAVGLADAWEEDDFELVETVEGSDDRLAARFRRAVRGKASGIADVLDYWTVNTFREGRLLRQEWFASRDRALEAAGPSK